MTLNVQVHCATYTLRSEIYVAQCTLYSVQYTSYSVHCMVYTIRHTMDTITYLHPPRYTDKRVSPSKVNQSSTAFLLPKWVKATQMRLTQYLENPTAYQLPLTPWVYLHFRVT